MSRASARAVCLDASVLVSLRTTEPFSSRVKSWCSNEPGAYTTPFCFYEALSIFKSKWKYRGQLTRVEYSKCCTSLVAWFGGVSRRGFVKDPELTSAEALRWVTGVVSSTGLDFSDAYQLYSVKHGYFSSLAADSSTVLATTDRELAAVAKSLDIRAIDLSSETVPS
jgi:predicted nucleic acid-binding protein